MTTEELEIVEIVNRDNKGLGYPGCEFDD